MAKRPWPKPLTDLERIDKWVREGKLTEDGSGCWLWGGQITSWGYASAGMAASASHRPEVIAQTGRVGVVVHRWMYQALVADIPPGLDLDHLCRVRHCVNPEHLEPVTRSVNIQRAVGVGIQWSSRTHCSNGHEYTSENTARAKRDGARECRECNRAKGRRYAARKRAERDARRDQRTEVA